MISKRALIDVSEDNTDSLAVKTEGMLLCGVEFPAAMTGSSITFAFSMNGSTGWMNVHETDGTEVSYTISAGKMVRVDPSGWAFASNGYIRVLSNGSEAADRNIVLHFRHS